MSAAPPTAPTVRPAPEPEPDRAGPLGLSAAQLFAGAGAAVTSAIIAGRVGVAGTLLGAALGSIVSTIAAATYAHSLTTAKTRIAKVRTVALPVGSATPTPTDLPVGETTPLPAVDSRPRTGLRRALTWRTGVVLGLASFVLAVVGVTVLELGIGRPVSADSGQSSRTSVGELIGGSSSPATPAPATTPSGEPTTTPSQSADPSATTSPSGSATTSPSESATTSPSESPTTSPSASPSTPTEQTPSQSPSTVSEPTAPVVVP